MELKGVIKNLAGRAESLDIHVGTGAGSGSPSAFSLGITLPAPSTPSLGPPAPPGAQPARGASRNTRGERGGGGERFPALAAFLRSATLEARLAESTRSWKEYSSHCQRSIGSVASSRPRAAPGAEVQAIGHCF